MEQVETIEERTARAQARATGVAGAVAIAAGLVVWSVAEGLRALDFPERTTKGWCSLVAATAALVQLASMTAALRARDLRRRLHLVRLHRTSGAVTLASGGFVTYLCFSAPFAPGVTLHRVTGFVMCIVALAKFATIRAHRSSVATIVLLGLVLATGFQIAFLTKGLAAVTGNS